MDVRRRRAQRPRTCAEVVAGRGGSKSDPPGVFDARQELLGEGEGSDDRPAGGGLIGPGTLDRPDGRGHMRGTRLREGGGELDIRVGSGLQLAEHLADDRDAAGVRSVDERRVRLLADEDACAAGLVGVDGVGGATDGDRARPATSAALRDQSQQGVRVGRIVRAVDEGRARIRAADDVVQCSVDGLGGACDHRDSDRARPAERPRRRPDRCGSGSPGRAGPTMPRVAGWGGGLSRRTSAAAASMRRCTPECCPYR